MALTALTPPEIEQLLQRKLIWDKLMLGDNPAEINYKNNLQIRRGVTALNPLNIPLPDPTDTVLETAIQSTVNTPTSTPNPINNNITPIIRDNSNWDTAEALQTNPTNINTRGLTDHPWTENLSPIWEGSSNLPSSSNTNIVNTTSNLSATEVNPNLASIPSSSRIVNASNIKLASTPNAWAISIEEKINTGLSENKLDSSILDRYKNKTPKSK